MKKDWLKIGSVEKQVLEERQSVNFVEINIAQLRKRFNQKFKTLMNRAKFHNYLITATLSISWCPFISTVIK